MLMSQNSIIVLILLTVVLLFLFGYIVKNRDNRKSSPLSRKLRKAPPAPLVAEPESPAYDLFLTLNEAIPESWASSLKDRVLREYPNMTEHEYEWRWMELRRFFMMCSVLKQVPMFSNAVDEVWHEMLMYTYEYQQFSTRFLGQMLHHMPNGEPSRPMPAERAWFDLIYVELFGWNHHSALIWGPFFRNPLPKDELEHYRDPASRLTSDSRFNTWAYEHSEAARKAIDAVLDGLRFRVGMAGDKLAADHRMDFQNTDLLLASAVFFSMNDPDNFVNHMVPQEDPHRKDSSGCSSASACGSGGDDTSNSGCSGSNCSSSSCSSSNCSSNSSCGGSSSCGGGCGGGGGD